MPEPLTITTPSDREIVIARNFDAPRDLVFLCFTPDPNCSGAGTACRTGR